MDFEIVQVFFLIIKISLDLFVKLFYNQNKSAITPNQLKLKNMVTEKTKLLVKTLNLPQKPFTFKDLASLNPNMPSHTLRLRLNQSLEVGNVRRTDDVINTGKPGRSQNVYIHGELTD